MSLEDNGTRPGRRKKGSIRQGDDKDVNPGPTQALEAFRKVGMFNLNVANTKFFVEEKNPQLIEGSLVQDDVQAGLSAVVNPKYQVGFTHILSRLSMCDNSQQTCPTLLLIKLYVKLK